MRQLAFSLPLIAALLAAPSASRAESGGKPISLGLVNIIHQGGMLPVFPFFNFSFK